MSRVRQLVVDDGSSSTNGHTRRHSMRSQVSSRALHTIRHAIPGDPVWHPLGRRRKEHRNWADEGVCGCPEKPWQAFAGPVAGLHDLQ